MLTPRCSLSAKSSLPSLLTVQGKKWPRVIKMDRITSLAKRFYLGSWKYCRILPTLWLSVQIVPMPSFYAKPSLPDVFNLGDMRQRAPVSGERHNVLIPANKRKIDWLYKEGYITSYGVFSKPKFWISYLFSIYGMSCRFNTQLNWLTSLVNFLIT